ncbi:SigE family RNA polymerase sigma factor [Modestobacter sp. SYSU DS0290]
MEPDDVSFHAFVRTWSPGLMRTAFLLTGDHGHAEDLLQTALMQVSRRWARLSDPELAYGYARTALVNTHTSWRRRRRVPERLIADHDEALPPAHEHFTPADRTTAALQSLSPGMRAVLVLRFHEDLSEADTARVLGCSVGNVKSQTSRALTRMREHLAASDAAAQPARPMDDAGVTPRRRP